MTEIKKSNERLERKQVSDALTALEQVSFLTDASTPYTLNTDGEIVRIDLGGSAATVNLPATLTAGRVYGAVFFNTGATATATFARNGHTMRSGGVTNGLAGGSADDWTWTDKGAVFVFAVSSSVVELLGGRL